MASWLDSFIAHVGVGHDRGGHSGRYPWGSGENGYQHNPNSLSSRIQQMRKEGMDDTDIYKALNLKSTQELRDIYRYENNAQKLYMIRRAKTMSEDGMGATAIGKELGVSEGTVRSWLNNEHTEARLMVAQNTADYLRQQVQSKGMVDVGPGVELDLNVSRERLNEALYILRRDGYEVYSGRVPQPTNPNPKRKTTQTVLCPPGTQEKEIYIYSNVHTVDPIARVTDAGETIATGRTFRMQYPESMDPSRLTICYGDQGGKEKDGLIEIRRGTQDLSLGDAHYAQVRILVNGTHYLKGMAVYADDLPDGIDVRFNTNKPSGTPMLAMNDDGTPGKGCVLKPISTSDPVNPFGSLISGQSTYRGTDGKDHLSLINIRANEGDWSEWADRIPAQFLAKQSLPLIRRQTNAALREREEELRDIERLTNPTIRRQLLNSFASDCDSAAVHLYAAALPGQRWHVILPVPSLPDNEAYAPMYENGTRLALIRYPHGGTFEIPVVTVNNNRRIARSVVGSNSIDAIGINAHVASRLSGADFDGDTVMAIPYDRSKGIDIVSTPELRGLVDFDPGLEYPGTATSRRMTKRYQQIQMGVVSNLITDMTLQGAEPDELARAVRHSMVVIDAVKHGYDYRASYIDNGIRELQRKYQPRENGRSGGAATLISRAKAPIDVNERQGEPHVNIRGSSHYDPSRPEGALVYTESGRMRYARNSDGTYTQTNKRRTQKSTRMAETDDARSLISIMDTPQEEIYASYANRLKSLANSARVEAANAGRLEYSPSAARLYATNVGHLMSELNLAEKNKPRERQASRIATSRANAIFADNPDMEESEKSKVRAQQMAIARGETGSRRHTINVTPSDWEAIQAGAISDTVLTRILANTDLNTIRNYATPRRSAALNTSQQARIRSLYNSNMSVAQIAEALGVSSTTVRNYLRSEVIGNE